jgi:hypothetical protein
VLNQKSYPSKEAATYAMNGWFTKDLLLLNREYIASSYYLEIQNAQDASLCRMELYYARHHFLTLIFSVYF